MKKIVLLFFTGLLMASLAASFSISRTANASKAFAITSTPAEESPTPLPTEMLTATPLPPPTFTPVPTQMLVTPTKRPQSGGGGGQPTPAEIPALGMGVTGTLVSDSDSPVTRLQISDLGLDSLVKRVPYDQGAWDITDLGLAPGWLETSSLPDLGGNTVLVGHLNEKGGIPGPFTHLDQLKPGSLINVYLGEDVFHYRVVQKDVKHADDTSALMNTQTPRLTLVTCYRPSWDAALQTYRQRLIVVAEPIDQAGQ
jgi:LPXTG-site transpeptidase (sortase) family protein